MQLLRNRTEWAAWAEGLEGVSIRHNYNAPDEPAGYPCYAYATLEVREAGYETERPRYLCACDLAAMTLALLEPAA